MVGADVEWNHVTIDDAIDRLLNSVMISIIISITYTATLLFCIKMYCIMYFGGKCSVNKIVIFRTSFFESFF